MGFEYFFRKAEMRQVRPQKDKVALAEVRDMVANVALAPPIGDVDNLIFRMEVPVRAVAIVRLVEFPHGEGAPEYRFYFFEYCFHFFGLAKSGLGR